MMKMALFWPRSLAPFEVTILNLAPKEEAVCDIVQQVVDVLTEHHIDTIVDDRNESPGIKFKDADLIGFPYQIVVGKKSIDLGEVELKFRNGNELKKVTFSLLNSIPEMLL